MYLLGAGSAFPSIKCSDASLAAAGASFSEVERRLLDRVGVSSRSISIPLEFVRVSKDVDILETRKASSVSPTVLGADAAKLALSRAGISIEQVGLIVADCATPYQTCPSEAQRIAGSFGVKVPAYDLTGGASAVPMFFNALSSWREDRTPEYVLCVSTNIPSPHIRYGSDHLAASVFGDAACAFVVSRKHEGPWRVESTHARAESVRRNSVFVERHISLDQRMLPSPEVFASAINDLVGEESVSENTYFIGTGLLAREFSDLMRARGVADNRIVSVTADRGYSIGSASGAALVDVWDRAIAGESVVLLHCGDGLSAKVVLMRT
jgi:3-oxoacyl-[acyl-carrier-protein] synthase III